VGTGSFFDILAFIRNKYITNLKMFRYYFLQSIIPLIKSLVNFKAVITGKYPRITWKFYFVNHCVRWKTTRLGNSRRDREVAYLISSWITLLTRTTSQRVWCGKNRHIESGPGFNLGCCVWACGKQQF